MLYKLLMFENIIKHFKQCRLFINGIFLYPMCDFHNYFFLCYVNNIINMNAKNVKYNNLSLVWMGFLNLTIPFVPLSISAFLFYWKLVLKIIQTNNLPKCSPLMFPLNFFKASSLPISIFTPCNGKKYILKDESLEKTVFQW